jgi:hypothetical protein
MGTVARPTVGWYLLPRSGIAYYGDLPEGVEVLDGPPEVHAPACPRPHAPKGAWIEYAVSLGWDIEDAKRKSKKALADELSAVEQLVDPSESDGPVGPEVAGVDLGPDSEQILTGPVGVPGGEQLDDDIDRHED